MPDLTNDQLALYTAYTAMQTIIDIMQAIEKAAPGTFGI